MNKIKKRKTLESLSTRVRVLAACPRIPLDNHYPIAMVTTGGGSGRMDLLQGVKYVLRSEVISISLPLPSQLFFPLRSQ